MLYDICHSRQATVVLFINDKPTVTKSGVTALFADHANCFIEIKSLDDHVSQQNDVNNMYAWSKVWQMSFNANKCKVMTVSRSHNREVYKYAMHNTVLDHI